MANKSRSEGNVFLRLRPMNTPVFGRSDELQQKSRPNAHSRSARFLQMLWAERRSLHD